jgi:hypothetical protein
VRSVPLQQALGRPVRDGPTGSLPRVKTCSFCGRQEPDEAKTLTWTSATENGRQRYYCDECSRTNLRAMEGKLDSEYW